MRKIVVIGGGAAGFFGAIECASVSKDTEVLLLEKSARLLSKVRVSGGGRCNVSNSCFDPQSLVYNYPRGMKELLGPFYSFGPAETMQWFESRGVMLKTEADGRIFPISDNSMSIVNCLLNEAEKAGVRINTEESVLNIVPKSDGTFIIESSKNTYLAHKVLVSAGGYPKTESYNWLKNLNHRIISPVPSLFTMNLPGNDVTKLMGLSVADAIVSIPQYRSESRGPLLITHWGMSGPSVLKLSAMAARKLNDDNYKVKMNVNWLPELSETECSEELFSLRKGAGKKSVMAANPFNLPRRLWEFIVEKSGIHTETGFANLSNEYIHKLCSILNRDEYEVKGKTTFKEEFVTCGGISLREVNFKTMESKLHPGLYFAGEVLDIDAFTGGFNFQAAWTSGWIAGKAIADALKQSNP
ncbi:MAG: NAD(P)/FAD-dependent oxidoreductase [Bacteroidetes bacterium]|nr:MAG: NAD(P)/FAD-dependent oxidoreductase [Bacteroidota bacterium]REK07018.1 MAG: NAD(P)/FAD-dependent oxidoreductase [Bacteroidota bacterium]REK33635.1 MAG: NAD(P)/FAD-dependent oxidoreductase [Bacteroidota bacterium]REK48621.1 MAG: NAD(P)/FAD-dependent oxidoreductase [Bacteroidota bacterium]